MSQNPLVVTSVRMKPFTWMREARLSCFQFLFFCNTVRLNFLAA